MASRIDELRRHRALLQEHLNWLDREIDASATAASSTGPAPVIPAIVRPAAPSARATPQAAADADRLFAEFRAQEEKERPPPTKAGCWIAFSLILLVLVGGVGGILYLVYR